VADIHPGVLVDILDQFLVRCIPADRQISAARTTNVLWTSQVRRDDARHDGGGLS
jgi:hypothetical protein